MGSAIQLTGANAFYAQKDYEKDTLADLSKPSALKKCHYRFETESKIVRVAKIIFAIIFFPVGIYWGCHILAGKAIVPTSATSNKTITDAKTGKNIKLSLSEARKDDFEWYLTKKSEWKVKRITVEVNGNAVDAVLIGKASTLNNGRWVLHSNGSGELYEDNLGLRNGSHKMLEDLNANGLFFNYPGAGHSEGHITRSALRDSYKGMLNFLEDKNKGLGAKAIICYGYSLGGAVQGEGIAHHPLKKGVKYIFIKDRTFSELKLVIRTLFSKALAFLAQLLGWNMNHAHASKTLKAPEIIIQSQKSKQMPNYSPLKSPNDIDNDGVIDADASHAYRLLSDPQCPKAQKRFVGIWHKHGGDLDWQKLAPMVNKALT